MSAFNIDEYLYTLTRVWYQKTLSQAIRRIAWNHVACRNRGWFWNYGAESERRRRRAANHEHAGHCLRIVLTHQHVGSYKWSSFQPGGVASFLDQQGHQLRDVRVLCFGAANRWLSGLGHCQCHV